MFRTIRTVKPTPMTTITRKLTRRQFLTFSALATGFALAAQPIQGTTVTTDMAGLVAGEVRIPVRDGLIPAYHTMPAQGTNFPVVLVVQEIFGVHAHPQDVCRRLAKAGYCAIAPELFARYDLDPTTPRLG